MWQALKWAVPILLVLLIVAYGLVSYLIASGVASVDRKPQEDDPAAHGLTYEDVEFQSRKGDVTLSGWYVHSTAKKGTLIFVHGINSNRSGDKAVELAERLVARGFDVLLFDLRAHGTSGGDSATYGFDERWDLLGAFDFLLGRGVDSERIGVVGFSMGAGTSLLALAEEPRIQALVADSPYAKGSDLVAHEAARKSPFPKWIMPLFVPTVKLMAKGIYDVDIGFLQPESAASRLPYPILVIHGMEDSRIPPSHGMRVHKAAHPDSEIWLVPDVDHVDAFLTHPDEYVDRVAAYLETRLGL